MIALLLLACTAEPPSTPAPAPTTPERPADRAATIARTAKDPGAFATAMADAKLDQAGFEALLFSVAKDPAERAAYIAAVP